MDVLMEIEDNHLEGALGKEFIRRGLCPELSLGYHVTMSKSPASFLRATNKKVVELSIVKQGARDGCKICAFTATSPRGGGGNKTGRSSSSPSDQRKNNSPTSDVMMLPLTTPTATIKRHKILI